jgi:subtilase family serine protease
MKSWSLRSKSQKLGTCALAVLVLILARIGASQAQAQTGGHGKPILINEPIDESRLIAFRGNTRPEANAQNDRGRVDDALPIEHMLLQLKRAPALEQQFDQYIDSLTDRTSPNFRQWMTAAEQGQQYGLAQQDLDAVSSWLKSYGFAVDTIYPNQMVIDFSGTAGEIRQAFHTEIHNLEVRGEHHIANMSDPQIPAALVAVVVGVVSLHDFQPEQMRVPRVRANYSFSDCTVPTDSTGNNCYALVAADLETIYNLNPLFRLGINGSGQTITLVEDSDTYSNDVATYRSTFLSKWSGTVTTTHPSGSATCTDPGTNSSDGEADLDAEVAGAMAPDASVVVATCKDGTTTNGVLYAVENLVNSATPPSIISQSYAECEAINGAASNAAFKTAFQTGAAAGVSIFVSAGDAGASGCAPGFTEGGTVALSGIGITGWGETVYNVSVGGTDFEDAYNATNGNPTIPISTYWNPPSSNTITDGSAKSYVPEIPWNDSCSGYLLYNYEGKTAGYGSSGECATSTFRSTAAAAGGPSACATGGGGTDQTNDAVVDGTCTGYPKPSWQSGIFGNPADGVRDIPDVSLFASNGMWGHYVTICYSDSSDKRGGTPCTGAPSTWAGFGGTSVAAPMMAAIHALVNEKWSLTKAGNPDPTYYSIAASEFGSGGNSSCYSINQPPREGLASTCVFYDITQGDNDIDCALNGTVDVGCYGASGSGRATVYGSLGTQALVSPGTVTAGGSGYTSAPTCTIGAPSNLNTYQTPGGTTLWGGGTQAICTATVSGGKVTAITITNGGQGYSGGASCTLAGGGGSGATCSASPSDPTAPASWQPAYGAAPGWDFATGLGSVNAYNLVFNSAWQ